MKAKLSSLAAFFWVLVLSGTFSGLFGGVLPLIPGDTDILGPSITAQMRAELVFMRRFIAQANPALLVEDEACALGLPPAILRQAEAHGLDWRNILALAWQESAFDCHAKNPHDKGGAYGPFQIRRLWEPVIGDPRRRYFDPELAVERVAKVMTYYRDTPRYRELETLRFRNPLLCLYNTGEVQRVNMRYCRHIGWKLRTIHKAWSRFQAEELAQTADATALPSYLPASRSGQKAPRPAL